MQRREERGGRSKGEREVFKKKKKKERQLDKHKYGGSLCMHMRLCVSVCFSVCFIMCDRCMMCEMHVCMQRDRGSAG